MAKGLFFGMLFVLVPVAGYLFLSPRWSLIRRYVWLWGWLAFAAAALAWPLAAYLRHPDIIDLWKSDYVGRLAGYLREPVWYYFAQLPYVLWPWSLAAVVGLCATASRAFKQPGTPERFLWCWAVLPVLFFTIPKGKHHHYLLHCMAPWSVLASLGLLRLCQAAREAPRLFRHPAAGLALIALPAEIALIVLHHRIPGPDAIRYALMIVLPLIVALNWWALSRPDVRIPAVTFCVTALLGYWCFNAYHTRYLDRHHADNVFVASVRRTLAESDRRLFVLADLHPLNASWLLFYLGERANLLHNATFLLDDRLRDREVLVVTRASQATILSHFGTPEVVVQSTRTRDELTPADRWTLFRVRFHETLARCPGNVYVSPMQATGRAPGPYLP
jgi:4-amino-4-deoxy-L-arabinose transferase-like glycosyltransferase